MTRRFKIIYVTEWDADRPIKLGHLAEVVAGLLSKYGPDTLLELDAGYNNVDAKIIVCKNNGGTP